jgi:hypothetical protein
MNEDSNEISLNQGKNFKDYQNKVKKNIKREGFVDVFQQERINNSRVNTQNQLEFKQLQTLQTTFNTLLQQYNTIQSTINADTTDYINRYSPSNPLLNKNVRLANGRVGYVTGQGEFKWYNNSTTMNATAGNNGCPASSSTVNVGVKSSSYNSPGSKIATTPSLLVGTPMTSGQACGNEGKNVWVTQTVNNPTTAYVGCYADNSNRAMNAQYSSNYMSFQDCQQLAQDNGYKYFGLQDYQSGSGIAQCMVSNDLTATTQYGNSTLTINVSLWTSTTPISSGTNTLQLTTGGSLNVVNSGGNIVYSTPSVSTCVDTYSVTQNADAWGNDITYLSGSQVNPAYCQTQCSANVNCNGFTMNTQTNNGCWIKSNVSNQSGGGGRDTYTRIPSKSTRSKYCNFKLVVQDDGNLVIYQNTKAVWATGTNGQQQQPNSNWVASKGKYGVSYLTPGQTLAPGEWIGSTTGVCKLMMQTDGNLVLYTSYVTPNCTTANGNTYGGGWANAVYQLSQVGNPASLGKLAYIDGDAQLREYPSSMLTKSNTYTVLNNEDSPGNNLTNMPLTNSSLNQCKTACNNNSDCNGFFFDTTNNCWLKNSGMYPNSAKKINNNGSLYLRNPQINSDNSCNKSILNVDSVSYNKYIKGLPMTSSTTCGFALSIAKEQKQLNDIKTKLINLANQIEKKTEYINSLSTTIGNQMTANNKEILSNVVMYAGIKNKLLQELGETSIEGLTNMQNTNLNMIDLNAMLSDSDIVALEQNYRYIFWSILAVGLLSFTISMKK